MPLHLIFNLERFLLDNSSSGRRQLGARPRDAPARPPARGGTLMLKMKQECAVDMCKAECANASTVLATRAPHRPLPPRTGQQGDLHMDRVMDRVGDLHMDRVRWRVVGHGVLKHQLHVRLHLLSRFISHTLPSGHGGLGAGEEGVVTFG